MCEVGNIWFLSDKNSHKNTEIKKRNQVQLSLSNPDRKSYFIVNGQAEISTEKKIEDSWSPIANKWFEEGQDNPNISIIRVEPLTS